MSNRLLFIGEFPPPYGGVTIKDEMLLADVFDGLDPAVFNLYDFKRRPWIFPALCLCLAREVKLADHIALGLGDNARLSKMLGIIASLRGERFLRNVTAFMMGRTLTTYLAERPGEVGRFQQCGHIYAESRALVAEFEELGVRCASYLPNFRKGDRARAPRPVGDIVRFVYFAQVRPEKGIETLADACARLDSAGLSGRYSVDVYGSVLGGYGDAFEALLARTPAMEYKGAFDAAHGDVYELLNRYDSSSSSSWQEGMSGSNIECKFAGVANIVSSAGFNPECVRDGAEGILVKPRDVDSLAAAMRGVIEDRELLERLKRGSWESRVEYDVATWRDEVRVQVLADGAVNDKG